jgi:hypothetical protein
MTSSGSSSGFVWENWIRDHGTWMAESRDPAEFIASPPAAGDAVAIAAHLAVAEGIEVHKATIGRLEGKGGAQLAVQLRREPLLLALELRAPPIPGCQKPAVEAIQLGPCGSRAGHRLR